MYVFLIDHPIGRKDHGIIRRGANLSRQAEWVREGEGGNEGARREEGVGKPKQVVIVATACRAARGIYYFTQLLRGC